MDAQRCVLVVDQSDDTQEVLKTALERRGLRVFGAGCASRGLELVRTHQPDLIVLDLEVDGSPPEELCDLFTTEARHRETPMVILGSLRRNGQGLTPGEFVSKPYHFGPLIRKIEELLHATAHIVSSGV